MNITSAFSPGWKGAGIALLIGALLGAAASWWIADKAHTAEMATLNNKTTSMLKQASDEASLQRDRNAQLEHDFASLIAAKEAQHTQELNDALAQNKTLRDAVTSGNRELRLAKADFATCNVSKVQLPAPPAWAMEPKSDSVRILTKHLRHPRRCNN